MLNYFHACTNVVDGKCECFPPVEYQFLPEVQEAMAAEDLQRAFDLMYEAWGKDRA